jgi:hypothetical protein
LSDDVKKLQTLLELTLDQLQRAILSSRWISGTHKRAHKRLTRQYEQWKLEHERLLTARQLARALRVPTVWIKEAAARQEIPSVGDRFRQSDVETVLRASPLRQQS